MKHSHCSSLLVFVHASNLAGCNSEDILEKAYQKSCYFQPIPKIKHKISRIWQIARAGK